MTAACDCKIDQSITRCENGTTRNVHVSRRIATTRTQHRVQPLHGETPTACNRHTAKRLEKYSAYPVHRMNQLTTRRASPNVCEEPSRRDTECTACSYCSGMMPPTKKSSTQNLHRMPLRSPLKKYIYMMESFYSCHSANLSSRLYTAGRKNKLPQPAESPRAAVPPAACNEQLRDVPTVFTPCSTEK